MKFDMKLNKVFSGVVIAVASSMALGSCTDQIKFGDSFLEKAPGGSATQDTIFNNAEYTRQFLTGVYALQYYGLPWRSSNANPGSASYWNGQIESLSDCWQLNFTSSAVYKSIYQGTLTASADNAIFGYNKENIWQQVHAAYLLMENIERTPDMEQSEKERMKAEAKCLIASSYFNLMRFYGGLPLIKHSYDVNDKFADANRASIESTVKFIVGLFDEAINSGALPWVYGADDAATQAGHWTKAAAMGMKCKVLQFAASPLFNDAQPYYAGEYTATNDSCVWYGGKKQELWTECRKACDEFFSQLAANGGYELLQAKAKTPEAYRYAYRQAYSSQSSPEVLMGVRMTTTNKNSKYQWYSLKNNARYSYNPTQEYVEMFPWADGKPFNWNETETAGKLDEMFVKYGDRTKNDQQIKKRTLTRDPRLYETICCNGVLSVVKTTDGTSSGANYEMYVGGTNAGNQPEQDNGPFGSGYFHNKYVIDGPSGTTYQRNSYPQWVVLRLSDLYLTYAEALLQADGNNTKALEMVDKVRERVGMKGLAECNPTENLTTNKENLLEEILRERACELGFENTRYFDMVRYKRKDLFERPLHGLRIYRLLKQDDGSYKRTDKKWYNEDRKNATKYSEAWYEPTHFEYEKFQLTTSARTWWSGFDSKWFLFPIPQSEVIKGYMTQNPGW